MNRSGLKSSIQILTLYFDNQSLKKINQSISKGIEIHSVHSFNNAHFNKKFDFIFVLLLEKSIIAEFIKHLENESRIPVIVFTHSKYNLPGDIVKNLYEKGIQDILDIEQMNNAVLNRVLDNASIRHRVVKNQKRFLIDLTNNLQASEKKTQYYRQQLELEISERQLIEEALRESGKRFRNIAFSLQGWIWEFNEIGVYTYCSEKVSEILGFSDEQMNGKSIYDFIIPAERDRIKKVLINLFYQNKPIKDLECWCNHKNGKKICILCTGVPILDEHGDLIGYRGVNKDITDKKNAEEQLNALNHELERSNLDLEQYAYVASHDLQAPLQRITKFVQLLSRRYQGELDEEADEYIQFIVQSTRQMQQLIKDLLAYSRVNQQGKPFAEVESSQIVEDVMQELKFTIQESKAELTYQNLPSLFADKTQFRQLIQNLVGNAIKFRKEEPPQITIDAKRENGYWIFSIADNGIGIEEKYFDKVFTIFRRLHTEEEYSGTGIGLSICKKIVERHHGQIWVESEKGQGAAFKFTIPAIMNERG